MRYLVICFFQISVFPIYRIGFQTQLERYNQYFFYTTDSKVTADRHLGKVTEIEQARDKARESKSIEEINKLENVVRKLASSKARQPFIIENKQKLQINSNCVEMFIINDKSQKDAYDFTTGSEISLETGGVNEHTKDKGSLSVFESQRVKNVVLEDETTTNKHEEKTSCLTISESQNKRNVTDKKTDLGVVGTAMKITVSGKVDESKETLCSSVIEKPEKVLHEKIRQDERENQEDITETDTESMEIVHRKLASSKQRHTRFSEKTETFQNSTYIEISETKDKFQEDNVLTISSNRNPSCESKAFRIVNDKGNSLEVVGKAMNIIRADSGPHENGDNSKRMLRSSFDKMKNDRDQLRETVCDKEKDMTTVDLRKRKADQYPKITKGELTERNKIKEAVGVNTKSSEENVLKNRIDTCKAKRTDIYNKRIDSNKKQIFPVNNDLTRITRYKPGARNDLSRSIRAEPIELTKCMRSKPEARNDLSRSIREEPNDLTKSMRSKPEARNDLSRSIREELSDLITSTRSKPEARNGLTRSKREEENDLTRSMRSKPEARNDFSRSKREEPNDLTKSMRSKPEARNDLSRSIGKEPETETNKILRSVRQKYVHEMPNKERIEIFGQLSEYRRVTRQTKTGENLCNAYEIESEAYNTEVRVEQYASSSILADLENRCKTDSPNFEKDLKRYLLEDAEKLDEIVSKPLLDTVKRLKTSAETVYIPVNQQISKDVTKSHSGRNLFEAMNHNTTSAQYPEQAVDMKALPRTLRNVVARVDQKPNSVTLKSENMEKEKGSAVSFSDVKKSLKIIGQKMKIHRHMDGSKDKETVVSKRNLRSSKSRSEKKIIVDKDKRVITESVMGERPSSHSIGSLRRLPITEDTIGSFKRQETKVSVKKKNVSCKLLDVEVTDFKRDLRSSSSTPSDATCQKSKKRTLRSSSLKQSDVLDITGGQKLCEICPFDREAKVFVEKISTSVGERLDIADTSHGMKRKSSIISKHLAEGLSDDESHVIKRTLRSCNFKDKKIDSPSVIEKKGTSDQRDTSTRSLQERSGRLLRSQSLKAGTANTSDTAKRIIDPSPNVKEIKKDCSIKQINIDVIQKNMLAYEKGTPKTSKTAYNIVGSSNETKGIRRDCSVKLRNIEVSQNPGNMTEDNSNIKMTKTGKQTVELKDICMKKMDKVKNINNSSLLRSEYEDDLDSKPRYKRAKTLQVCRPQNKKGLEFWDRRLEIIGHHIQARDILLTNRGIEFPVNLFC